MRAAELDGKIVRYKAEKVFLYPQSLMVEQRALGDIALIKLERNVTGIRPIEWRSSKAPLPTGTHVRFAGWGRPMTFWLKLRTFFGRKKLKTCTGEVVENQAMKVRINKRLLKCESKFVGRQYGYESSGIHHVLSNTNFNPSGTFPKFTDAFFADTPVKIAVASGDSGSGAFVEDEYGQRLVGVVSAAAAFNKHRSRVVVMAMDYYNSWIKAALNSIDEKEWSMDKGLLEFNPVPKRLGIKTKPLVQYEFAIAATLLQKCTTSMWDRILGFFSQFCWTLHRPKQISKSPF